jgi:ferrochelatase
MVISNRLKEQLQKQLNRPVEMAMRYGQPSIEKKILTIVESAAIEEILFIPLYPHFAQSTVTTSIREAQRVINKHKLTIKLSVVEPFYENPAYITALVNSARPYLENPYDHIVFSYHGLPESHITKLDVSGQHCLQHADCCNTDSSFQNSCYRRQVLRTTECFAAAAGLLPEQYSVAFQSRLGRAKWLGPNTEDRLRDLATEGCKEVLVICPAFVTDCLETLEEIAIRGQDVFKDAGGDSLTLIPCLNDRPEWVQVLKSWSSQSL